MRAPASFPYPASSPPRTVCLVLLAPLLSLAQGIAPTPSHPLAPAADAARVAAPTAPLAHPALVPHPPPRHTHVHRRRSQKPPPSSPRAPRQQQQQRPVRFTHADASTPPRTGRQAMNLPAQMPHISPHLSPRLSPRLCLLAAAAVLAGCASVSPDGLRGDVATLAAGRTGGVQASLPAADPAARASAEKSVEGWLAQPLTQDAAVRIALLHNPGLQARLAALGVADAERVQAITLPNPHLALGRFSNSHEREIERTMAFSLIDLITL